MVDRKQFIITWHIDNLRLSHVNNKAVGEMIEWMKGLYSKYVKISKGKKHD